MPKAVVLLSGGLDSATVLAVAIADGFDCSCLTIRYGQRHDAELKAAVRVAEAMGVVDHRFATASLDIFGGSALTDDFDVPKNSQGPGIPITYVPARNTVLLSLALAYAEVLGADHIMIGANSVDYSGYPDCRPEFIDAFERLANVATKAGVEGRAIHISAPLMKMSKSEIIQAGLGLGVDYGLTHSCYDPGDNDSACGECDACLIRGQAFRSLGMSDPALDRTTC